MSSKEYEMIEKALEYFDESKDTDNKELIFKISMYKRHAKIDEDYKASLNSLNEEFQNHYKKGDEDDKSKEN